MCCHKRARSGRVLVTEITASLLEEYFPLLLSLLPGQLSPVSPLMGIVICKCVEGKVTDYGSA